ncbi:DNA polymerase III subunit alpha [Ligilactobacillus ceti]|uniref:DNA polymerase III subunit alpha n=1 Tax=Ligilactobacillus ceti DSM 22408 TaxID=1122146 RepID=A0A0R2KHW6_9LACO|nr:DNA polymerase III subunit alpha [Ligilactobacillus ceti]KRN88946.1 DNA polymerase III alpha subunit [Ligilactobacillus ceti DSM 22408]
MYCPLQVNSSYSLLNSTLDLKAYLQTAQQLGYQSLALTDTNVMYGALEFYKLCQQHQIKPIVGITLEMTSERAVGKYPNDLLLLAKNEKGYHSLMKISTMKLAHNINQPAEHDLRLSEIAPYLEDVIAIIPTQNSYVRAALAQQDDQAASLWLMKFKEVLGDNLYLGVSLDMPLVLKDSLLTLAKQVGIKAVVSEQVQYLYQDDHFEVEVLRAIRQSEKLTTTQMSQQIKGQHYLRPKQEYVSAYQQRGDQLLLEQTEDLIAQINLELNHNEVHMPHFKVPESLDAASYLKKLCQQGLEQIFIKQQIKPADQARYQERLNYELKVIHEMGYDDYFLIVWDVTDYAHRTGVLIGPGRGSAAGSLVAYTLAITDVDPLQYNLLFERFLNPERSKMPDIDLDIPDEKRDLIIKYVHEKYGHEKMAQIITFGTLAMKQAIRDVARVMGASSFELKEWSKALSNGAKTLQATYKISQRLRNLVADSQKNELIYKTALKLEGLPRHYSKHAAGVIFSDHPLDNYVPLQIGNDGILLSQYDKDEVEQVGLLKMDFLGLRNLSILKEAVDLVVRQTGEKINIKQIPLNDKATLEMFARGDTLGIFQFESSGIRNVLKQVKPTSFEDVAAVNAIYRPGPMENIPEFVKRKHGEIPISYPAAGLENILKPTYGIMVYQEQVMQVAAQMAGFSLGQADLLRRAMSDKKKEFITQMEATFITGALEKGYTKAEAEAVYQYISRFANYGFNRSHAVAYSKMAFQLAYLKTHYPAAFYVALLNSVQGKQDKVKMYLTDALKHHVKINGPKINQSYASYTVQDKQIYLGLNTIKFVRRDFVRDILAERKHQGGYKSLADFLNRINEKYLSAEYIEPLIYAGVFDDLEDDRNKLLDLLPKLISNINLSGSNVELFSYLAPKKTTEKSALSVSELLAKEYYYLGAYLTGHPVDKYQEVAVIQKTITLNSGRQQNIGDKFTCLAYITRIKVIRTKKGSEMAFVTVSDKSGESEVTIFPRTYAKIKSWLQKEQVIYLRCHYNQRADNISLIADDVKLADELVKQAYYLRLPVEFSVADKEKLQKLILNYQGEQPVIIYEAATKKKYVLNQKLWLRKNDEVMVALTNLLGSDNVVLR